MPEGPHHLGQPDGPDTELAGTVDQITDGSVEGERIGVDVVGDTGTPTDPGDEQSLLHEGPVGPLHGLQVHAEGVGELAAGSEALPGSQGSRRYRPADAGSDLHGQRDVGGEVDLDEHGSGLGQVRRADGAGERRSMRLLRTPAASDGCARHPVMHMH